MANSNRNCLLLSRLLSAIISSITKSVSECTNSCDNFLIHWKSLSLGSASHNLPSFLIHSLAWYVLFHRSVGKMMIMWSKCLLYSFSIKSKTRWVLPQPVGSINMAVWGSLSAVYSLSFFFIWSVIFLLVVYYLMPFCGALALRHPHLVTQKIVQEIYHRHL